METGAVHHIISGHKNSVIKVATSPVEDMFATASGDMTMRLWKYSTIDKGKDDFQQFLDMESLNNLDGFASFDFQDFNFQSAEREPMVGKRSNLHDLLS
jgi:WD40 repeat protein